MTSQRKLYCLLLQWAYNVGWAQIQKVLSNDQRHIYIGGCGRSSWTFWAQAQVCSFNPSLSNSLYSFGHFVLEADFLRLPNWLKIKILLSKPTPGTSKSFGVFKKPWKKCIYSHDIFGVNLQKNCNYSHAYFWFFKKWIENDFFRKSLLACPKIVVSTCKTPRLNLLEYALLLRCFPAR